MKYLALINDSSGTVMKIGAEAIAELIRKYIGATGAELEIINGDCETLLKAAEDNADTVDAVICAGGDGTQAGVAGKLRGKKAALLPLPCGTMNLLCRDLGVPLDIEEALQVAVGAPVHKIDIGVVTGDGLERTFLNNVVFGSYAEIAEAREEIRKMESIADFADAVGEAMNAFFHATPIIFKVKMDGKEVEAETNTVVVSINRITDSENMVPHRDRLSGGALIVYLTEAKNHMQLASVILEFLKGEAEHSEKIDWLPCNDCAVDSGGYEIVYTIDGDPITTDKPIELTIERKSVKVFYPNLAVAQAAE